MESSERLIVHQDQDGSASEAAEATACRQRRKGTAAASAFVTHSPPVTSRWNHSTFFDGRLFLSRLKASQYGSPYDLACIGVLSILLAISLIALYLCYFHFAWFHFHVTHAYARIGHVEAQHLMGDKFLHGNGVDKDEVITKVF